MEEKALFDYFNSTNLKSPHPLISSLSKIFFPYYTSYSVNLLKLSTFTQTVLEKITKINNELITLFIFLLNHNYVHLNNNKYSIKYLLLLMSKIKNDKLNVEVTNYLLKINKINDVIYFYNCTFDRNLSKLIINSNKFCINYIEKYSKCNIKFIFRLLSEDKEENIKFLVHIFRFHFNPLLFFLNNFNIIKEIDLFSEDIKRNSIENMLVIILNNVRLINGLIEDEKHIFEEDCNIIKYGIRIKNETEFCLKRPICFGNNKHINICFKFSYSEGNQDSFPLLSLTLQSDTSKNDLSFQITNNTLFVYYLNKLHQIKTKKPLVPNKTYKVSFYFQKPGYFFNSRNILVLDQNNKIEIFNLIENDFLEKNYFLNFGNFKGEISNININTSTNSKNLLKNNIKSPDIVNIDYSNLFYQFNCKNNDDFEYFYRKKAKKYFIFYGGFNYLNVILHLIYDKIIEINDKNEKIDDYIDLINEILYEVFNLAFKFNDNANRKNITICLFLLDKILEVLYSNFKDREFKVSDKLINLLVNTIYSNVENFEINNKVVIILINPLIINNQPLIIQEKIIKIIYITFILNSYKEDIPILNYFLKTLIDFLFKNQSQSSIDTNLIIKEILPALIPNSSLSICINIFHQLNESSLNKSNNKLRYKIFKLIYKTDHLNNFYTSKDNEIIFNLFKKDLDKKNDYENDKDDYLDYKLKPLLIRYIDDYLIKKYLLLVKEEDANINYEIKINCYINYFTHLENINNNVLNSILLCLFTYKSDKSLILKTIKNGFNNFIYDSLIENDKIVKEILLIFKRINTDDLLLQKYIEFFIFYIKALIKGKKLSFFSSDILSEIYYEFYILENSSNNKKEILNKDLKNEILNFTFSNCINLSSCFYFILMNICVNRNKPLLLEETGKIIIDNFNKIKDTYLNQIKLLLFFNDNLATLFKANRQCDEDIIKTLLKLFGCYMNKIKGNYLIFYTNVLVNGKYILDLVFDILNEYYLSFNGNDAIDISKALFLPDFIKKEQYTILYYLDAKNNNEEINKISKSLLTKNIDSVKIEKNNKIITLYFTMKILPFFKYFISDEKMNVDYFNFLNELMFNSLGKLKDILETSKFKDDNITNDDILNNNYYHLLNLIKNLYLNNEIDAITISIHEIYDNNKSTFKYYSINPSTNDKINAQISVENVEKSDKKDETITKNLEKNEEKNLICKSNQDEHKVDPIINKDSSTVNEGDSCNISIKKEPSNSSFQITPNPILFPSNTNTPNPFISNSHLPVVIEPKFINYFLHSSNIKLWFDSINSDGLLSIYKPKDSLFKNYFSFYNIKSFISGSKISNDFFKKLINKFDFFTEFSVKNLKKNLFSYPTKRKNYLCPNFTKPFLKYFRNFYCHKYFNVSHSYFNFDEFSNYKKYIDMLNIDSKNYFNKLSINFDKDKQNKYMVELLINDQVILSNVYLSKYFILIKTKKKKSEDKLNHILYKSPNQNIDIKKFIIIPYDYIQEILIKQFIYNWQCCEILCKNNKTYLINFLQEKKIQNFFNKINEINGDVKIIKDSVKAFEEGNYKSLWEDGKISTFDFLNVLNKFGSRTYNYLNQYPVFPWVFKSYEGVNEMINSPSQSTFRRFEYPISLQDPKKRKSRLDAAEAKKNMLSQTPSKCVLPNEDFTPNVIHYSVSAFILYFIPRTSPYTEIQITFQSGVFDNPSRFFTDFKQTKYILERYNDNRELLPEFYYMCEAYYNINYNYFGVKNNKVINDVILPKDFVNSAQMVFANRKVLECNEIIKGKCDTGEKNDIGKWIDLVFGCNNRFNRTESEDKNVYINLFQCMAYEDSAKVKLEKMNRAEAKDYVEYILSFGISPCLLINEKLNRKGKSNITLLDIKKEMLLDLGYDDQNLLNSYIKTYINKELNKDTNKEIKKDKKVKGKKNKTENEEDQEEETNNITDVYSIDNIMIDEIKSFDILNNTESVMNTMERMHNDNEINTNIPVQNSPQNIIINKENVDGVNIAPLVHRSKSIKANPIVIPSINIVSYTYSSNYIMLLSNKNILHFFNKKTLSPLGSVFLSEYFIHLTPYFILESAINSFVISNYTDKTLKFFTLNSQIKSIKTHRIISCLYQSEKNVILCGGLQGEIIKYFFDNDKFDIKLISKFNVHYKMIIKILYNKNLNSILSLGNDEYIIFTNYVNGDIINAVRINDFVYNFNIDFYLNNYNVLIVINDYKKIIESFTINGMKIYRKNNNLFYNKDYFTLINNEKCIFINNNNWISLFNFYDIDNINNKIDLNEGINQQHYAIGEGFIKLFYFDNDGLFFDIWIINGTVKRIYFKHSEFYKEKKGENNEEEEEEDDNNGKNVFGYFNILDFKEME